jgi:hypothetical protein
MPETSSSSSSSSSWGRASAGRGGVRCLFAATDPSNADDEDGRRNNGGAGNSEEEGGSDAARGEIASSGWDGEETLLAMHLSPLPGRTVEECWDRASRYTQAFPFAAVLPVQPLRYLPTPEGGVDVTFLRKQTETKGGVDGGIRFSVSYSDRGGVTVTAKRNSAGQAIGKIFAEKIAVLTYVRAVTEAAAAADATGSSGSSTGAIKVPQTRVSPPTADVASVDSLFHKWM